MNMDVEMNISTDIANIVINIKINIEIKKNVNRLRTHVPPCHMYNPPLSPPLNTPHTEERTVPARTVELEPSEGFWKTTQFCVFGASRATLPILYARTAKGEFSLFLEFGRKDQNFKCLRNK